MNDKKIDLDSLLSIDMLTIDEATLCCNSILKSMEYKPKKYIKKEGDKND